MSDAQPSQIVMRSPELAHANVVVNERDRAAFEAKGYEYAGPHRVGDPAPSEEPATEEPAPQDEAPAVDAEALTQPDVKGVARRKTK